MLVALYARHSTDKQSKSTWDQITRLREHCERQGYTVVEAFIDEAKSGADMRNRRGIRRLLDRAQENIFSCVICEDLSRLSRDQGDIAWIYKRLSYVHISIETLSEGVVNELHIGLKGTMNALYLKDLADKTHRGVVAAVRKGGIPGGRLYGYDVARRFNEDGEPVRGLRTINEAEAAIVRQIFADYAAGVSLKAICTRLDALAIDAPKGGKWAPTTLVGTASRRTGLLRQTLYKGVITFNRMAYRKHPETGKRLAVVRPEDEWLSVPAPELAIVEPALFDRVQTLLEERSSLKKLRTITNKVLTPKEKAERAAKRQAAWRAKQMMPRKNIHTVVGGRLWCGIHGEKILQAYNSPLHGPIWTCSHKDCPNRNLKLRELPLPLTIAALGEIGEATLDVYLARPDVVAERARLQMEIDGLRPRLEGLRAELANVITALGRQAKTQELRDYFTARSMEIRRVKLDVDLLEGRLARLTGPVAAEALSPFRYMVGRLRADPTDKVASDALRPVIKRIILNAPWTENDHQWRYNVRLELDHEKLLKMTIPEGLKDL